MEEWWARALLGGRESYAAGNFLELPEAGVYRYSLHRSIETLYVRKVFDALYKDIVATLAIEDCSLCHLNGNSGVGKSAFLWYFIIRTGIDKRGSRILYESETYIWDFNGSSLRVIDKKDYPLEQIESTEVDYHLIDQKIAPGRTLGVRAVVAASPEEGNTKAARKLRMTYTRYLPVWDKQEFDALVQSWKRRADLMPRPDGNLSVKAEHIYRRVDAADLAYDWFGGVPRFLWDREAENLTEEDFSSDVCKCLANTKLKNVTAILQNSATTQNVSWRLFHFALKPGSFRRFYYTFCSDKVANMYAQYLCTRNVDKIRSFLEATQPFKEYASLRGFVFEQYAIGQALQHNLMALPMIDSAYCGACHQKNERGKAQRIQCGVCLSWYHTKCVRVDVIYTPKFRCGRCHGAPGVESVSPGGLLLRYYEGDLEDALLAAGMDAAKYLWRPLKKNNAVFGFVLLPRTLGQATVSRDHKPAVKHLVQAMQALRRWRQEYDPGYTEKDDTILLFFVPPDTFSGFQFQPYRVSGKVSQKAVEGVLQCKVAVPVQGSPYVTQLNPRKLAGVVPVDLDRPETWEDALGCVGPAQGEDDGPEVHLTEEKIQLGKRKLVYEGKFLDALQELDEICMLEDTKGYRSRLVALCKIYKLPANSTNLQMLTDLKAKRQDLEDMDMD
ncbi:hypothetical protein SELMODRAFT_446106 [Selaginella moellendorffii]|uniref:PHD-type domain-containing protein n=1 Tax=Selaginella moellendorffii TaxID=88036 RepID=D8SNR9_SELML|nr:uncharacterized protein LOC9649055 [Selaginella moellendorffii]EFJ13931.1 hypothetical protein SELMODRAFT_446106 [Selaginella moellendorffii]|eukprot:XP_002985056.1 uncharacterized protein LOC9649055 [Selaginella moellendorffii]